MRQTSFSINIDSKELGDIVIGHIKEGQRVTLYRRGTSIIYSIDANQENDAPVTRNLANCTSKLVRKHDAIIIAKRRENDEESDNCVFISPDTANKFFNDARNSSYHNITGGWGIGLNDKKYDKWSDYIKDIIKLYDLHR